MNLTKSGLVARILWIMVISLVSCNPPQHTYSSDQEDSKAGEALKILFLDYQLTRDATDSTYVAQLINMIIRNGTIKEDQHNASEAVKDDLELLVLDRNQQTISHRYIPNPLDRSVEYVNDAGQFERRMIHLDSAQFSIRLQIESGAGSIVLNRFIANDAEALLLLKTKIL